jgi:transposase
MTICIGIDVHKKKCVATLKRDSQIVEQISFYNNGHGIKEFIEHIKLYSESATAVCESTGNYWIRLHVVCSIIILDVSDSGNATQQIMA